MATATVAALVLSSCSDTDPATPTPTLSAAEQQQKIDITNAVAATEDYTGATDDGSLTYTDSLSPGAKIAVQRADGAEKSCSIGWIVTSPALDNGRGILTAGHCGGVGDQVTIKKRDRSTLQIGSIVRQELSPDDPGVGEDYALIELTAAAAGEISTDVSPEMQPVEQKDMSWVEENKPYICARGFHQITCGAYARPGVGKMFFSRGETESGDSGGAVWAIDPADKNTAYAIGIIRGTSGTEENQIAVKPIDDILGQWDLELAT